jgi:nitrite reductase/ring-hydroxylating ferredoxin subunit
LQPANFMNEPTADTAPNDAAPAAETRRDFCARACRAAFLSAFGGSLGGALSACGGSGIGGSSVANLPVLTASSSGTVETVSIDAGSPLATVGGAALVEGGPSPLLVARTGESTFVALTAICTHQGCTVSGFANGVYVCPCHGSEFSTSGSVLSGPAPAPLSTRPTSFAQGVLTITIA